ncbi:hypothetical protein MANES_12G089476v8 [Manihot esculenta]|uniref:Uncharacterized protein n=1 Tax=Manihot esculenta TaxID=3983 RepID=A0ACB7GQ08_MANES|nr:hypothetical protein MANES_12G089476v8 [Manihot esculenta]
MGVFCMHVRPPKEVWLATYKSPSDRKWASFLPILELRVLKLGSRFGELGDFKSLGSPHLKFWVAPTLDLQEVSVDLCFSLHFMKF